MDFVRETYQEMRRGRLPELTIAALTIALPFAGCQGASEPEAFKVSDSSGVSIITNHRPSDPGVPQLGPALLSIGADGGFPFGRVSDAVVLEDDRIAVLDGLARRVYLFEPSGQLSDSLGREGDGPGEFRRPSRLGASASSGVLVFDALAQRVTRFPVGSSERELATWALGSGRTVGDLAFLSAELAVVVRGSFRERMEQERLSLGYHPIPGEISLLSWASGDEIPLSEETISSFTLLSGNLISGSPFAHRVLVAATDSQVVVASTGSFSLRRYDLDGRLIQEIRYPPWVGPVKVAELDSLREEHRRLAGEEGSIYLEGIFAPDAQPELRPSVGRMLMSPTGWIWVGSFSPNNGTPESWAVFDSDGVLKTILSLPPDSEPLWIGRDKLVLRQTDALGVQSVRIHELRF